ncbi:glycoside hydrolase family 7 protein [Xylariaceae sp. FL1651]|nr:glycoside hydrolase family 7 protein [Xylariaceae sp. FL1651]
MANKSFILGFALLGITAAQTPVGAADNHPQVTTYRCTQADGCKAVTNYLVLDSSAHWVHQTGGSASCGSWGSGPDATACPTEEACAQNCVMESVQDYTAAGVTTNGSSLHMEQIHNGNVVSPRVYLLNEAKDKYEMLKLTGGELSFDIDATHLPCGMNSALYLDEMAEDGGKSDLNPGGATWGTGYCDAQCYVTPFINGVGNVAAKGACCNEMDIWEANGRSTQMAPHTCNQTGLYRCAGDECAAQGVCDKNGCGWNTNRLNQTEYYGKGANFVVDTTKPFTVVTQFPADANGTLTGIRRLYVQGGKVIKAEVIDKEGIPAVDYTTDEYCAATGSTQFMRLGALAGMGQALSRGMVLTFSLWWDDGGFMHWLDSTTDGAGPCNATEGDPNVIRAIEPSPQVTFSNMKWGEINSTFSST